MKSGMPPGYRMRANWNFVAFDVTAFTGKSAARRCQATGIDAAIIANPRLNPRVLPNRKRICLRFPAIACPKDEEAFELPRALWDRQKRRFIYEHTSRPA